MLKSSVGSLHRIAALMLAAVLIGTFAAGCSGGSGANTLPPAPLNTTPPAKTVPSPLPGRKGEKLLAKMSISRASIPSVMNHFRRAGAHALMRRDAAAAHGPVREARASNASTAAGEDLTYNGGPTVPRAAMYNILVNCDESCWGGAIAQFQNDLSGSQMIHITDQYVNVPDPNRYTYAGDIQVQYDTSTTLQDQDMYNIVYQVAAQFGTGYNAIYHIFLPQNVQQCSQSAGGCYPQYCGYHSSVDFSDIGHTLFSVEPYQNVQGCTVSDPNSPNGVLADSTASTLSHETFETITDPDIPSSLAWYNKTANGEIGDLCRSASIPTNVVQLGQDNWEIQPEYDDSVHDCSYTP
jgi:hypothetical protein